MSRMLLVEDVPEYAAVGSTQLAKGGVDVVVAQDYVEAQGVLTNEDIDMVVTDCFFPERTNSGRTGRGRELLDRLAEPQFTRYAAISDKWARVVDTSRPEIQNLLKLRAENYDETREDIVVRFYERLLDEMSHDGVRARILEDFAILDREEARRFNALFLHERMNKALEKSDVNQPLGLLVAAHAERSKLPFIITTSTSNHDLNLYLVTRFVEETKDWGRNLMLTRYFGEKDTPKFWNAVSERLEQLYDVESR